MEIEQDGSTVQKHMSKLHIFPCVCVCARCCVCTSEYSCVFACLSFTREQVGQDAQIEVRSQQLA